MANANNEIVENESGVPKVENEQPVAPKKADVLIKSTNHIAMKQEELSEQTKQIASRLDEAIEQFTKNGQDASYIVQQSGEIFSQLQSENAALKQELMYLAKQNENIYAGLDEKLIQLTELVANRGEAGGAVSGTPVNNSEIIDRLNILTEQNRRYEVAFEEIYQKLEAISEQTKKTESEASQSGNDQISEKLNYITEQLRKSEGARTMLADKFEILSMRVEQFGLETAKGAATNHTMVTPVAFPMQGGVQAEIDYDKLAQKVADLISAREVVSPDYIASKVAEQVIIPEVQTANVAVDANEIAQQVAEILGDKVTGAAAPVAAGVNLDEEGLAERIARKIGGIAVGEGAVTTAAPLDEDELVERIARKVGNVSAVGVANVNIDEDELADSIALKVGSLKAEDFEILVDDAGCTSISKEITENLDYNTISNIIADKLREVLDLNAANAPDYEEMAERISEKITVAGINEAAIADKAAAALSNYLPEIDTDEIADKVTGAVIDVVSAMPQPTVDTDTICNTISEKLIQSQEDHDYDVVIDEEGIAKISELVTEEIEKQTSERFDKVESGIENIYELIQSGEAPAETTEVSEEVSEEVEEGEVYEEPDYSSLAEIVAAEIEKGTASRFDKVEDDIAKLSDLVSSITVEDVDEYAEEEEGEEYGDEEYVEEDYTALSEVVAAEIEKGVGSRLSGIEENVAKLTEYLTAEEETAEEGEGEEYNEEYSEEEAHEETPALSEEISVRLSGIEENVAKIAEYLASEEPEEQTEGEENGEGYVEEPDYAALSEVVAAEIERGVAFRLSGIEDNLTEVKEGVAKLNEYFAEDEEDSEEVEYEEIDDYAAISEIVAAEIERGVSSRLDGVEEKLTTIEENTTDTNSDELMDKVKDDVAQIKEMLSNGVLVASETAASAPAAEEIEEEEGELVTVSDVVEPEETKAAPVIIPVPVSEPEDDEEFEEDEEESDNDEFTLDVLDMDAFSDDELMPGELSDYADGVDFASMMKYKRSFIARIIQSDDNCKQYYGEVKHALLSYKKVNSNVAWGAERFNKGRETVARIKMRGKTLCLYLALDPKNYKTTVYHHLDVSENKSVAGTPMMVKIKSNLGVRKAIRLIDEMLSMRDGEKREILERDYAAMYPYETIEDLIEEGLVKDVRKK